MAKVVITIEDDAEGNARGDAVFDPPITREMILSNTLTQAQIQALEIIGAAPKEPGTTIAHGVDDQGNETQQVLSI